MQFWTQEQLLFAARNFDHSKRWRPWVRIVCHQGPSTETYHVALPCGVFGFTIVAGDKTVKVRTSSHYLNVTEEVTPVQARYRFLRAVIGHMQESGQLRTDEASKLFAAIDKAACELILS